LFLSVFIAALAAFAITIIGIVGLRPIAVAVKLVDRPGGRKTHRGKVPVIGGLAMFVGIVFGLGTIESLRPFAGSLLAAFALVVAVGLLDDRFGLSPWVRLPAQAAIAALLTVGTGTEVSSIGDAFGFGPLLFHGPIRHLITILFVITAINAVNMIDGMDGLAGMVAIVAVTTLGLCGGFAGQYDVAAVCAVFGASIAAFLMFNLPVRGNRRVRCFMGDAGSTLLGVALAWICIRISQDGGTPALSPVNTLWIVALPIFEFFWTFFRRLARGRSPLEADAEHFHHLLMKAGFGIRGAFMMFLTITLILTLSGLVLDVFKVSEYWSLAFLLLVGVMVVSIMYRARLLLRFFPQTARRRRAWVNMPVSVESHLEESAAPVTIESE
jgi:UDP-GlcNAc:undecaprenyl-phosphate GlcNAc-1-phosphate transferase